MFESLKTLVWVKHLCKNVLESLASFTTLVGEVLWQTHLSWFNQPAELWCVLTRGRVSSISRWRQNYPGLWIKINYCLNSPHSSLLTERIREVRPGVSTRRLVAGQPGQGPLLLTLPSRSRPSSQPLAADGSPPLPAATGGRALKWQTGIILLSQSWLSYVLCYSVVRNRNVFSDDN